ncbi:hypothetical protein [Bacillus weihaiensis]|uniref:hypothetical protein n=1 Tax=Bacillus weihaiensis TaxID=1547283 RepID=UPI00235215BC|nr:hypothetical protein [Bacillus weihaiensis]
MNKFIRIFLCMSVPFGLLMMVQSNILFGSFLVKENLIGGIVFGGVMALVLTIMDRYFRKNKSLEINSSVKQQSTIEMPFSYEKTYQLC